MTWPTRHPPKTTLNVISLVTIWQPTGDHHDDESHRWRSEKQKKGKKGGAETTKMDHLRMYTFARRILESRPRMCGFLGGKVPFLGVIIPKGIRRADLWATGRLPLFPKRGPNLFRKGTISQRKRGPTCEGLRGDCDGTARELRGQVFWGRETIIKRTVMRREKRCFCWKMSQTRKIRQTN